MTVFSSIAPIPPIPPIEKPYEVLNSYSDGFARGFQIGLDEQRDGKHKNSDGYKATEVTYIEDKMFKLPYELMAKIIEKKDKEFTDKYGTIENRKIIFNEYLTNGLDAFNKKKYSEAINICKQAQETQLNSPLIDMILGGSYYSIGDYDSSIFYLKSAKNNGYAQAEEYIKLIKNKEKQMVYVRRIKFGAKIGYNFNSMKSSPLLGLFFQGRVGAWGIKNFCVLEEIQFYQAKYLNNLNDANPYYNIPSHVYEYNDNILQINILFKNTFNKNFAIVYGIGLSAGTNSAAVMLDVNGGIQYHFSQYFFSELRYNRNISRSYQQVDGVIENEPNNIQFSLGYKF